MACQGNRQRHSGRPRPHHLSLRDFGQEEVALYRPRPDFRYSVLMHQGRLAILLSLSTLSAADLSPGRKYTTIQRLEDVHLEATHAARVRFAKERRTLPALGVYTDYHAVMHV